MTFEFWDDDIVSGDDFLGVISLPLSEVVLSRELRVPLLSANLGLWNLGGEPTATFRIELLHTSDYPQTDVGTPLTSTTTSPEEINVAMMDESSSKKKLVEQVPDAADPSEDCQCCIAGSAATSESPPR